MRKVFAGIFAGLMVLASSVPVVAQRTPYTGQVPCARILALGSDKLQDLYQRQHSDDPRADVWAIADYNRCKRAANDAQLKLLQPSTRNQILGVRKELDNLINDFFVLAAIDDENANGETTVFERDIVAKQAEAEVLIGAVANIMSKATEETPSMRSEVNKRLPAIQEKAKALAKPKRKDLDSEAKENYDEHYSKFKATIESVVAKIRSMPATAGLRVARFIDDVFGSFGD